MMVRRVAVSLRNPPSFDSNTRERERRLDILTAAKERIAQGITVVRTGHL